MYFQFFTSIVLDITKKYVVEIIDTDQETKIPVNRVIFVMYILAI